MREIKFRAWDKRHKSMEQMQDLYWFEENYVRQAHEADSMTGDWVIMQYTGLKDRHGVDIYEGDIVTNRHDKGKIVFHEGGFVSTWKHRDYNPHLDVWIENGKAQIEVIGNIYENPERLNEK